MPFRFRGKFQLIPPKNNNNNNNNNNKKTTQLTLKKTCRGKMILLLLLKKLAYYLSHWGKIQGDGRKFLDRFKNYSGSQISSQSLNEVHIYQLQPKSATKGDFFHIFFLFDCFELASRIANDERSLCNVSLRDTAESKNKNKNPFYSGLSSSP